MIGSEFDAEYGKTSPHGGQKQPRHALFVNFPMSSVPSVRRALGIGPEGELRVRVLRAPGGVMLKADPTGLKLSPSQRGASRMLLQARDGGEGRFIQMLEPSCRAPRCSCRPCSTCALQAHPRDRQGYGRRHRIAEAGRAAPTAALRPREAAGSVLVLVDFPGQVASFNVPVGVAINTALDWAAYREKK